MRYLEFLRTVHRQLEPQRYLEIGVRFGDSMAQARCKSVGIDPDFYINAELDCEVSLMRTTSDEYFARDEPLAVTGGLPFDLAFIDGLHLFEFALRDFIQVERHSSSYGVIVFDDVLPRTVKAAARIRQSAYWTGDVYPMLAVLARLRPELTVIPVSTDPTGLLLVTGLDPENTVLADNYDDILAEFRSPDPQPVPVELMDRLTAVAPERVLASPLWRVLAEAGPDDTPATVRERLAPVLTASLGDAFRPGMAEV